MFKHGDAVVGRVARLYSCWHTMKDRCSRGNCRDFKSYGGRGIKVCREWLNYIPFKKWAIENGYNDTLTIDRIDNDGDYTPINCQWISKSENSTKSNLLDPRRSCKCRKLSMSTAIEVRRLYKNTDITLLSIAKQVGVSKATIHRIVCNVSYKESGVSV